MIINTLLYILSLKPGFTQKHSSKVLHGKMYDGNPLRGYSGISHGCLANMWLTFARKREDKHSFLSRNENLH